MFWKKKKLWQAQRGNPKEERDIVIGFDFGTSCSKIILRDFQRKEAFAVPFEEAASTFSQYLIPTKIYINPDGCISLSRNETEIDGLKVNLIKNTTENVFKIKHTGEIATSLDLAVAYIGLVLINIRNWFKETKRVEYRHIHINWQLNIGIPSRSYDDRFLCNVMKRSALAGWNLSLLNKNRISLPDVKTAIEDADFQIRMNDFSAKKEQIHPDYVNTIPEIIAEVIGYFRSPMRETGMYLIVDVGARTMDVSTFIVHEIEGEDLYPILTAEVEILGTFVLHQNRLKVCREITGKNLCKLISSYDGISPLPEVEKYLSKPTHKDVETFNNADMKFRDECSRLIRKVIKVTKDCRNPYSRVWSNGLPVFLCGGGAQVNVYQSLFNDIEKRLEKSRYSLTFNRKELPFPRDLKNDDIHFNRMAVAYGLSFPKYDIGDIIPPDKIKDLVPNLKTKDIENFYIDKDMV